MVDPFRSFVVRRIRSTLAGTRALRGDRARPNFEVPNPSKNDAEAAKWFLFATEARSDQPVAIQRRRRESLRAGHVHAEHVLVPNTC